MGMEWSLQITDSSPIWLCHHISHSSPYVSVFFNFLFVRDGRITWIVFVVPLCIVNPYCLCLDLIGLVPRCMKWMVVSWSDSGVIATVRVLTQGFCIVVLFTAWNDSAMLIKLPHHQHFLTHYVRDSSSTFVTKSLCQWSLLCMPAIGVCAQTSNYFPFLFYFLSSCFFLFSFFFLSATF